MECFLSALLETVKVSLKSKSINGLIILESVSSSIMLRANLAREVRETETEREEETLRQY